MFDYKMRRNKVLEQMPENSVFVFFGKRPFADAKKYDIDRNFLYLTGLFEFDDILVLSKKAGKIQEKIYIHQVNLAQEAWTGKTYRDYEVRKIANIEEVGLNVNYFKEVIELLDFDTKLYVLFNEDDTDQYSYTNYFLRQVAQEKNVTIVNGNNLLKRIRSVKEADEVEMIKKANNITRLGLENILKHLKPGLKEYQIETYFDQAIKYNGATGYAFPTIAASGINATCLHYNENNSELKDGDLILFDLGASCDTYCSDVSRTYPINGKFSERQKLVYEIVLNGQKLIESVAKAGYTTKELNQILIDYFAKELKKIGLIKEDSEVRKYYFHGVSHHLGMDCHDFCLYEKLPVGAVISNEPGLYIPEWNIGVRIEDDLYLTADGCINLSAGIIKEVEDIEKFMQNNK